MSDPNIQEMKEAMYAGWVKYDDQPEYAYAYAALVQAEALQQIAASQGDGASKVRQVLVNAVEGA